MPSPLHGGPLSDLEGLLQSRSASESAAEQRQALAAIGQLEALRQGSAQDQDLRWYYLTFCLGWGFTTGPKERRVTGHGRRLPRDIGKHLGMGTNEPRFLGVRPAGTVTTWAMVDIDTRSRYHPASDEGEGVEPVRSALAAIGLRESLEVQSSHSEGVHLWFPLPQAVPTLALARDMEAACLAAGLEVRDGVLELRPNVKAGGDYRSIRAPLTGEGNALWVDGLGLDTDLAVFRSFWEGAQGSNRLAPHGGLLNTRRQLSPTKPTGRRLREALDRLAEGFTGPGQTDDLKLAALQIAGLVEGLQCPDAIGRRCAELLSLAPGFAQHWALEQFGRPWLPDYAAAHPEQRSDLSLAPGEAPASLVPPFAAAFSPS
jgi:hypothetical protein